MMTSAPWSPPSPDERRAEAEALKAEQTPTYLALVDRLMRAEAAMGNRPGRIVLDPERWQWLEAEVLMVSRATGYSIGCAVRLWLPWGPVDVVSVEQTERRAIRLRALAEART